MHPAMSLILIFALSLACSKKSSDKASPGASMSAQISDDPVFCSEYTQTQVHQAKEGFTSSAAQAFQAKVDWSSPLIAGELNNGATLSFLSSNGKPAPLALNSFKLFMPAMGHGSIKADKMLFTQQADAKNIWSVSQIYFSMGGAAGEWLVEIEASACGISDKARVIIEQEVQ